MPLLKIAGGTVYDPANGINGAVQDLWVRDGTIVNAPLEPERCPEKILDARGLVIMPGGVDVHAHIVSSKVNAGRLLQPAAEVHSPKLRPSSSRRSGAIAAVPDSVATGYLYAGMGYTTVLDAAVAPLFARHAHAEMRDTPIIDKCFLALCGNNHYVLERIAAGDRNGVHAFAAWLLGAVKGYGLKVVNPCGVEAWKEGTAGAETIDSPVGPFRVSPRQIMETLAETAAVLGLPHPVHIHCNHLGVPGNSSTTLATMRTLDGLPAHLAHVQFHSYGGEPNAPASLTSRVPELADYVNRHPHLSVDVGQVLFGATLAMTADGPLANYLHRLTGHKWLNQDVELETSCGVVPIRYRNRSLFHSVQWAAGLEWLLLITDPWRISLSTDHPNGASFLAYPQIIQLLMDREVRRETIRRLPDRFLGRSSLWDLDREYTLAEIAIITRAAPARILGLKAKGHLGAGADADIAIYTPSKDIRAMFELPRHVLKGGEFVIENGEMQPGSIGTTLYVRPRGDPQCLPDVRRWFQAHSTIQFANYPVHEEELAGTATEVPCVPIGP